MKKVLFTCLTLIVLVLSACSGSNEETTTAKAESNVIENKNDNTVITQKDDTEEEQEPVTAEPVVANEDKLDAVVNYFKDNGYSIGEKQFKSVDMIKAQDGFGIEIDGENVEFYLYDPNSEALNEIIETGKYNMDGFEIEAISNGTIVMIAQFHPDKEKLVETFKSYK